MRKKMAWIIAVMMVVSLCTNFSLTVQAEENISETEDVMLVKETEVGKNIAQLENSADKYTEKELSRLYQIEVEKLGEQYFPEYAEKNSNLTVYSAMSVCDNGLGEVISSETKPISKTESLIYTEYSSGRASLFYMKDWTVTSSRPTGNGGTTYKRTIVVTIRGCVGSVYVSGFEYTLNLHTYDWIDNVGSCYDSFGTTLIQPRKMTEDAYGDAYVSYGGNVEDTLLHYPVGISYDVHVGNNTIIVYDADGNQI